MPTTARTQNLSPQASPDGAPRAGRGAGKAGTLAPVGQPDVTARLIEAEQELASLHAELERLHRLASIGTIAGMIAHEFNNILTPIVSYSQMALAAPEDRELARKSLQRTLAGSERAAKIADAILSFVRDDAARTGDPTSDLFHVEQTSTPEANVAQVVDDALACLGREGGRPTGDGTVRVPATLTAAIQPIALQQVLVNLILNARNAMRGSGGTIEVSASRWVEAPTTPKGAVDSRMQLPRRGRRGHAAPIDTPPLGTRGPWVCIVVRDSGRGMDSDRLTRLFRPFDTGTTGEVVGTGLGMVITKRLVERVGGWMIVESSLGRGTTTTIVLPESRSSKQ